MLQRLAAGIYHPNPVGGNLNTGKINAIIDGLAADAWKLLGFGLVLFVIAYFIGKGGSQKALAYGLRIFGALFVCAFALTTGPAVLDTVLGWFQGLIGNPAPAPKPESMGQVVQFLAGRW